jgi:hypothetical protein
MDRRPEAKIGRADLSRGMDISAPPSWSASWSRQQRLIDGSSSQFRPRQIDKHIRINARPKSGVLQAEGSARAAPVKLVRAAARLVARAMLASWNKFARSLRGPDASDNHAILIPLKASWGCGRRVSSAAHIPTFTLNAPMPLRKAQ